VTNKSKSEPEEFHQSDDVHAEDEAEKTSNGWEEVDPGHARLTSNLRI
jgi:hypothetical protein